MRAAGKILNSRAPPPHNNAVWAYGAIGSVLMTFERDGSQRVGNMKVSDPALVVGLKGTSELPGPVGWLRSEMSRTGARHRHLDCRGPQFGRSLMSCESESMFASCRVEHVV